MEGGVIAQLAQAFPAGRFLQVIGALPDRLSGVVCGVEVERLASY